MGGEGAMVNIEELFLVSSGYIRGIMTNNNKNGCFGGSGYIGRIF